MHTAGCAVDGMLQHALTAFQPIKGTDDIVVDLHVIHVLVVFSVDVLKDFHFLDKGLAHEWSQIEVECWNRLPAVHFVLGRFHRDACEHACGLDAFGWA